MPGSGPDTHGLEVLEERWPPLFGQVPGPNQLKSFCRLYLWDVGARNTGGLPSIQVQLQSEEFIM